MAQKQRNRQRCNCCGGSGPPTGPSLPGCACRTWPTTLHLSASGPCGAETFPTADFTYGPTPSDLTGLDLGPACFLSDQTFSDRFSGSDYKLHLGCDSVFVRLSRVYLPGVSPEWGPYGASHDATLYAWSLGQPGNTCTPLLLSVGFIYPGGNPRCTVVVTE